jgi:hypothetical protein
LYNDGDLYNRIAQLEYDAPDITEDKEITEVNNVVTVESDELPAYFWSMDFDGAVRKEGAGAGV